MSRTNAVITAIGADRPGIVDRLAGLIHEAGGNIEESRMAILGGDFALIQLFSGSPAAVAKVRKGLGRAARALRLSCTMKITRSRRKSKPFIVYRLNVSGLDHPGIVHRVAAALSRLDVNVATLDTHQAEAPMSGAPVFRLAADLQVPADLPAGELRRALERVCAAEAVDFALEIAS